MEKEEEEDILHNNHFPKAIVFDLDYTLWPVWCDTHVYPPVHPHPTSKYSVIDSSNREISFYPDVPEILAHLNYLINSSSNKNEHQKVETLVTASRTATPYIAKDMLRHLHVPKIDQPHPNAFFKKNKKHTKRSSTTLVTNNSNTTDVPASDLFQHKVWGTGSKVAHFKKIAKLTGIAYKDMLFFDDEYRNIDVQHNLGVTFVLVDETVGLDWDTFWNGIEQWRSNRKP